MHLWFLTQSAPPAHICLRGHVPPGQHVTRAVFYLETAFNQPGTGTRPALRTCNSVSVPASARPPMFVCGPIGVVCAA